MLSWSRKASNSGCRKRGGTVVASIRGRLAEIFDKREQEIAQAWLERQAAGTRRLSPAEQHEAHRQSREFLSAIKGAVQQDGTENNITGAAWTPVREFLTSFSASRAKAGFTPTETASFIFSLKQPVFD